MLVAPVRALLALLEGVVHVEQRQVIACEEQRHGQVTTLKAGVVRQLV